MDAFWSYYEMLFFMYFFKSFSINNQTFLQVNVIFLNSCASSEDADAHEQPSSADELPCIWQLQDKPETCSGKFFFPFFSLPPEEKYCF